MGCEKRLDGQALATPSAAAAQHGPAGCAGHAGTETMDLNALALLGLESSLHVFSPTFRGVVSDDYVFMRGCSDLWITATIQVRSGLQALKQVTSGKS